MRKESKHEITNGGIILMILIIMTALTVLLASLLKTSSYCAMVSIERGKK